MVVPLICRLDIYKFRNAVRRIVVPVILLRSDWSVCLEVNCGEAGCLIVNGSAVCLCIDTDPWTPTGPSSSLQQDSHRNDRRSG